MVRWLAFCHLPFFNRLCDDVLGKKMSAQNKAHLTGFLRMGGRFMNDLGSMNTLVTAHENAW